MAKVIKLKVKNPHYWGGKLNLPGVGETKVNKQGILELEEETLASLLLNNTDEYELVEGNGTTVTKELHSKKKKEVVVEEEDEDEEEEEDSDDDEDEDSEEEEDDSDDDDEEEEDEDEEEEEEDLSTKTLKELIKIAEEAEIPEEDYAKFKSKKALMLNFLKKELK